MSQELRVRITGYRYRGPHAFWPHGRPHWDWRVIIRYRGVQVWYSQGYCTWERAAKAAERKYKRLQAELDMARI